MKPTSVYYKSYAKNCCVYANDFLLSIGSHYLFFNYLKGTFALTLNISPIFPRFSMEVSKIVIQALN